MAIVGEINQLKSLIIYAATKLQLVVLDYQLQFRVCVCG